MKMKLSGFTYIRNGHQLNYPFLESIRSALPICDEMIVVVGDSVDGTRESVEAIGSEKIRIIDTVWDDDLKGGLVFRNQANIGLDHITGQWGLHIQADEILHENERHQILEAIDKVNDDPSIDGLLFRYIHFWGYHHHIQGRRARRYEIRVVRNDHRIRSYRDSQGFRKYPDQKQYEDSHPGEKISTALISPYIYHYSRVRDPKLEMEKVHKLASHLHGSIGIKYRNWAEWDYTDIDWVEPFAIDRHPEVMLDRVRAATWELGQINRPKFHLKNWLSNQFESLTGIRVGEYTNWKIKKRI